MAEGKIHLKGEVWTWKMPSWSAILIRDPKRKKTAVKPWTVLQTWHQESQARNLKSPEHSWNGRDFSNITPAMVKVYIEKNLA